MEKEKKYEFTGEEMEFEGHTLRRIRYLRPVKGAFFKLPKGGWIESEDNLSHDGECSILHEAKVFGNACVMHDAIVFNNGILKDNAQLKHGACVFHNAKVGADTIVGGTAKISGDSEVYFFANPLDDSIINLSGDVELESCIVEATGTLEGNRYQSEILSGKLS